MKITKKEKWLYKLLNIVNTIFGKTNAKTYLAGVNRELYFGAQDYCGVFVSKEESMLGEYDFGNSMYQLKQLPSKEYVLDTYDYAGRLEVARDIEELKNFINRRIISKTWRMEMTKDYSHKAAKIAADTGKWLKDDDIVFLKQFPMFDVFTLDYGLAIRYADETYDIWLVFMDSVVLPLAEDATQVKIDAYIEKENKEDEVPEEFEDEFDPMA